MDEYTSKQVVQALGLKVPRGDVLKPGEAVEDLLSHADLHFPLVLKVCSAAIPHKTDVGGVLTHLNDVADLQNGVADLRERFPMIPLLIEEMVTDGVELILGGIQDPSFGPSVLFGLGGIYTEVWEDVVFRVASVDWREAFHMMEEIRGKRVLEGIRGHPVDREAIAEAIAVLSQFLWTYRDQIDQVDWNPVLVRPDGLIILDAKVFLK